MTMKIPPPLLRTYALLVMGLALSVSCGESVSAPDAETRQLPLWRTLTLGAPFQGADNLPMYEPDGVTPAPHCVAGPVAVTHSTTTGVRSAFVYEQGELATKVSQILEPGIAYLELNTQALEKLVADFFVAGRTSRVALVAIRIENAREAITPQESGPACGVAPTPESLRDFVNRCGSQYLSANTRGGYVFVAFDTLKESGSELYSNEVMTALFRALGIGLRAQEQEGEQALNDLTALLLYGGASTVRVLPWGFEQLPEVEQDIPVTSLLPYIGAIRQYAHNGPPTAGASRYGRPIAQTFSVYDAQLLGRCGYPESYTQEFACYHRMWSPYYNMRYSDEVRRIYDELQWLTSQADRVEWEDIDPTRPDAARDEYLALQGYITSCYQNASIDGELPLSYEERQCRAALNAADDNSQPPSALGLCAFCTIGRCSTETILAAYNALPAARVMPPPDIEEVQQGPYFLSEQPTSHSFKQRTTDYALRDALTHVCSWGGLSGKMDGGGERVRLHRDGGNEWHTAVNSGRTEPAEKLSGFFACTARANFLVGNSPATWLNPEPDQGLSVNASFAETELLTGTYAAMVSGISGKMRGFGESVGVEYDADPLVKSRLQVASQQGYLKGWAMNFGVSAPTGGTPTMANLIDIDASQNPLETGVDTTDVSRYVKKTLGVQERRLAFVNEAFCFLTDARGVFDGGGERARLFIRDGVWMLDASAGCADRDGEECDEWKGVSARARCMKYQQ